jgi:flavodoxin I
MKALVIYDSVYGNTEKIARAIGGALSGEVKVLRVSEISPSELGTFTLVIVGSPTNGGRPTTAVLDFLAKAPGSCLKGLDVAAFDTRLSTKWVGIFGYAAGKIGSNLKSRGSNLVVNPEGFFVKGTKGPLKDGESERAANWAKSFKAVYSGKKE